MILFRTFCPIADQLKFTKFDIEDAEDRDSDSAKG